MKTLNKNSAKQLNILVKSFNALEDVLKIELMQKEIIAKFGIENFENAQKEFKKNVIPAIAPIVSVPDNKLLSTLNAIGITDKLKEKGGKSIFKSEFNNKTDRTKCRNAFQNALSVYLLHLAHDKKELAETKLKEIKVIADKYYIAGATFKNKSDYCTDNMEQNKKDLIDLFISNVPKELALVS